LGHENKAVCIVSEGYRDGKSWRVPAPWFLCLFDSKTFTGTESCLFVKIGNVTKGGLTVSADTAEGVKKRICGRPQPRPAHRWSWPDLPRAIRVKFSCRFCLSLHLVHLWFVTCHGHVPGSSGQYFSSPSWFPMVCDYWSGKRRDPIATANSVKSIVESSWFLKKVDEFSGFYYTSNFLRILRILLHLKHLSYKATPHKRLENSPFSRNLVATERKRRGQSGVMWTEYHKRWDANYIG